MPRVDFYILSSPAPDAPQRFACRLADKAWQSGHNVFVRASSEFEARQIDDLMWTFRPDSFVPHGLQMETENAELPVLIGDDAEPAGELDVVINLAPTVPGYFERCTRIAELVGNSAEAREAGRQRYRFYRDREYSLDSHNV